MRETACSVLSWVQSLCMSNNPLSSRKKKHTYESTEYIVSFLRGILPTWYSLLTLPLHSWNDGVVPLQSPPAGFQLDKMIPIHPNCIQLPSLYLVHMRLCLE